MHHQLRNTEFRILILPSTTDMYTSNENLCVVAQQRPTAIPLSRHRQKLEMACELLHACGCIDAFQTRLIFLNAEAARTLSANR